MYLINTLTMEANSMFPDHFFPYKQSDLGLYCVPFWLPKYVSRMREQTTNFENGGKSFMTSGQVPNNIK